MKHYKLNLQLFAETQADANTTTSSGLSHESKVFYEKTLIELAGPELVHDRFAQKKNIPANAGATIEFRKFSPLTDDLSALVLKEDEIPEGQALEETAVTGTISDFGGYVKITDKLELTAIDKVIVEATKKIAEQAGKVMDTVTREKMMEGTNVYFVPAHAGTNNETAVTKRESIVAATCYLRVKDIFRGAAILKAADAKQIDGAFVAIVHPNVAYDLMMGAGAAWIDITKYNKSEEIFAGEIGRIGGVRFVESSQAKVLKGAGASGANVYVTFIIAKDAYATTGINGGEVEHIFHGKGEIGGPLNQYSTVGWKGRKTAEILHDPYLLRIESGCTIG